MRELGSMRQREHQSGFGTVEVLLVVLVVAILAVGGFVVYQRHNNTSTKTNAATSTSQTNTQQSNTTSTQSQPPSYLTIKEWGVKIPLSSSISDAYYVIPQGISNDADGKPSAINFGLASLNSSCGTVTGGPTDYNSLGSIVRALPTDTDPVSGKLYTQLDPNGVTIAGYYYGYADASLKSKTCISSTSVQSVDSAFATAVKSAVTATTN
jgi:type II secretory pathway pseudopilin PulG